MIKEQTEIEKALEILKKQGYEVKEPKPKTFTLQELSDELNAIKEATDDIVTLFNMQMNNINNNFALLNEKVMKKEKLKIIPLLKIEDEEENKLQ